jgi:prephenate dehydrogenase
MGDRIVGIIGTGSIGGSIGKRLREGDTFDVFGYDTNPAAIAAALATGAIDAGVTREELYARADVVVIASHLDATVTEIQRVRLEGPVRADLILDVASVKLPVTQAAAGIPNFVATHPMAGSERSGASAARPDAFEGRAWAYVPSRDEQLDERARLFIESLGGVPVAVEAAEHDRIVALTSHVPQLVGSCYAHRLRERGETADALCGPVARELLRVSQMNFSMWRAILRSNAPNIEPELRLLAEALLDAADALRDGDVGALYGLFPPERAVG